MSQKTVVLAMLKERGAKGVGVHELIYKRGITRAAAIVFELRQEGFDIETIDGQQLPDGRTELAKYVLQNARRTLPPAPPPGLFDAVPGETRSLALPCGCVRAADGKGWESRCAAHSGQPVTTPMEVQF